MIGSMERTVRLEYFNDFRTVQERSGHVDMSALLIYLRVFDHHRLAFVALFTG